MAFIEPAPGKPFAKNTTVAGGDVSAIIGVTGDAIGSLAISFSEPCICFIAGKILGETFTEANQDVFDAAGEITNMVSGVARSQIERLGLTIFAAIPSIAYGKGHTFQHILKTPSIVVPFTTAGGNFIIDVCLETVAASARKDQFYGVTNVKTFDMAKKAAPAASPQRNTAVAVPSAKPQTQTPDTPQPPLPAAAAPSSPESIEQNALSDLQKNQEKLQMMRDVLAALTKKNAAMKDDLLAHPFMPLEKRSTIKKETALYAEKIRRLKLDIKTIEMLSSI